MRHNLEASDNDISNDAEGEDLKRRQQQDYRQCAELVDDDDVADRSRHADAEQDERGREEESTHES